MPSVVAAVVAIVEVIVAVAQVVAVVSQVASLFIRPEQPGTARGNSGITLMVREPDHPRRLLFGRARVGGIWFYTETVGPSNDDLWLVLGISEGITKGPVAVYFGEDRIEIEVTGQDDNGNDIYEPVPRNSSNDDDDGSTNAADILRPRKGEGISIDDDDEEEEEESGRDYRGSAFFTFYKGDQTQADARLVAASSGNWNENCKVLGISYCVVNLIYDSELFGSGIPQISFLWEGQAAVFDPRDGSTGFSDNAALCIAHYMTLARIGPNADYETEIDEASLIAAANACDEQVEKLGGTERRYTCDGVVSVSEGPEAIIASMLTSMGGFTSYAGGRFTFGAAVWRPPSFELTLDHIVTIERFQNRLPKRSRVNTVKGLFVSEANLFQSSDFPTRTSQVYLEADGEELVFDLDLRYTESPSRAQRLANIVLEDRRLTRTLQVDCTLEAFRAQAGKNIMVTIPRYGLNRHPFLVEGFSFAVGDDGSLLVSLTLNESSSSIYDWNVADELPVPVVPTIDNDGVKVSAIVANPPPGTFLTTDFPLAVELSTLTSQAGIRWSRNIVPENVGSGSEYTGAIILEANDPLFARGFRNDYADSPAFVGVYAVEQVERPTLSPEGGAFASEDFPLLLSAVTVTPGAVIRWRIGSEPTSETDGNEYTGPFEVTAGATVYVRAFRDGLLPSLVTQETYSV